MKLDYKKIIKRIKVIHKQIESYLDDYLDESSEDIYVSFEYLNIGDNIGGYTFDYLWKSISLSMDKEAISFSLPVPYDDEYLNGSIPYEWLDTFEAETFAKPILDKYIQEHTYMETIKSDIKKEYFYFPDSMEMPYKMNYHEVLEKGTIVGIKSKDPESFFKGVYGVDPIKIEDLKMVDTTQYKKVYELPTNQIFEIKYYL